MTGKVKRDMKFIDRETLERNAALLLAAMLLLFLSGCGGTPVERGSPDNSETAAAQGEASADARSAAQGETAVLQGETDADAVVTRLAVSNDAAAMGLVKLMSDSRNGDKTYGDYDFTLSASPDEISSRLIGGELDIACVPANLAAALCNATDGGVAALAVNTLGGLYVVERGSAVQSIADLRGMTIAASDRGGVAEYAFRYLLSQNGLVPDIDVFLDWKDSPGECVADLALGAATVALLPQPFVAAAESEAEDLRVALDLAWEWDSLNNGSALVTGVTVARREFIEEHPAAVARFLDGCAASAEWVSANASGAAALIDAADMFPAPVAEKALPHCGVVCLTGADMASALSGCLSVLYDAAPESVGGSLPNDDFYYQA